MDELEICNAPVEASFVPKYIAFPLAVSLQFCKKFKYRVDSPPPPHRVGNKGAKTQKTGEELGQRGGVALDPRPRSSQGCNCSHPCLLASIH